jgi:hypothetical protein
VELGEVVTRQPEKISAANYRRRHGFKPDEPKRPKYRAVKTTVDGIVFDSKREASRYLELRVAEKAGAITNLRLQVSFALVVNRMLICQYEADFVYVRDGAEIVEDAKGKRTREYSIKKKLMYACHGIRILET